MIASGNDYRANENGRRHATVDIAVVFVGAFFVGRKGGDTGCVGDFDDGVEVEYDGAVRLVAEVWEVQGDAAQLPLDAGDKFADLYIELDGVDVDNIVGAGFGGIEAGAEGEGDAKAVGMATGELHHGQRSAGEE